MLLCGIYMLFTSRQWVRGMGDNNSNNTHWVGHYGHLKPCDGHSKPCNVIRSPPYIYIYINTKQGLTLTLVQY